MGFPEVSAYGQRDSYYITLKFRISRMILSVVYSLLVLFGYFPSLATMESER